MGNVNHKNSPKPECKAKFGSNEQMEKKLSKALSISKI